MKHRILKRTLFAAALTAGALALTCLAGCKQKEAPKAALPKGAYENEILTLKPVAGEKELVTIHYEYGMEFAGEIESAIEQRFPNVDIVMVHDGASDSNSALLGNLKAGTACDIVFDRYVHNHPEVAGEYFLEISAEDFINNFYLTALDQCIRPDGKLYYLPGPTNLHGILCDKTVLDENGWALPTNYSEFAALIRTIDASGLTVTETLDGETKEVPVRGFRPSLKYSDAFRTLFYPFAYQSIFAGHDNLEWLSAYKRGEAGAAGHLEPLVTLMQKLTEDGVVRPGDWDYLPRYRVPMLAVSHSAVMISGPMNTLSQKSLTDSGHEYVFLPVFTGDGEDDDYLYSIPNYFMGITRRNAEQSPERKRLLLDIMAYLCDPGAQSLLFGAESTVMTNIKGGGFAINEATETIRRTLAEGRIITDITTGAEGTLNGEARAAIAGELPVAEYLAHADAARDASLSREAQTADEVVGTVESDLTRLETALLVANVMKDVTGADIALVLVDQTEQGANCRLFAGELILPMLRNIVPDRVTPEGQGIATATLKGQRILDCLAGMQGEHETMRTKFYVAAGLKTELAPWMPAGERLVSATLPDGKALDPDGDYKVAYLSDRLLGTENGDVAFIRGANEQIRTERFEELFRTWLAERGGVVKAPERTVTLNWKTK
ncbi:MAG: 5'-nucleotidase C-terminal domain-containing protein [Clostridia bacterium]|nr:5'-nucleotidase C-terminal domain-containing protein [Clostridia bacterium]